MDTNMAAAIRADGTLVGLWRDHHLNSTSPRCPLPPWPAHVPAVDTTTPPLITYRGCIASVARAGMGALQGALESLPFVHARRHGCQGALESLGCVHAHRHGRQGALDHPPRHRHELEGQHDLHVDPVRAPLSRADTHAVTDAHAVSVLAPRLPDKPCATRFYLVITRAQVQHDRGPRSPSCDCYAVTTRGPTHHHGVIATP